MTDLEGQHAGSGPSGRRILTVLAAVAVVLVIVLGWLGVGIIAACVLGYAAARADVR